MEWRQDFNLERMFGQELEFAIERFDVGARLEAVWWLEMQAVCLNVVQTYTPIRVTITTNNKLEECDKQLITVINDQSLWTDGDAAWLDWSKCDLASGSDWNMYEFAIEATTDLYILGSEAYDKDICFPGNTPFGELWKYQDNPFWGYYQMFLRWL